MKIQINIETKSDSEMNHMQYLTIANTLDDVIKDIKNDPHKYLGDAGEFEKRYDDYGVVIYCAAMPGHDAFEDDNIPEPVKTHYSIVKAVPCTRNEYYEVIATSEDEAIMKIQNSEVQPVEIDIVPEDYFGDDADYIVNGSRILEDQ